MMERPAFPPESRWPETSSILIRDILISCRQCPTDVRQSLSGACKSSANGDVHDRCGKSSAQTCSILSLLPHAPFQYAAGKSMKCDLCANAPYFGKKGGPLGQQACVSVCPAEALKLVASLPAQRDNSGYDLNLAPGLKRAASPLPQRN
jgi:ferredoxin